MSNFDTYFLESAAAFLESAAAGPPRAARRLVAARAVPALH